MGGYVVRPELLLDGTGKYYDWAEVGVEGERIAYVGPRRNSVPTETEVLDLSGMTLLPGLVDTHVHLAGGAYETWVERAPLEVLAMRTPEVARRTLLNGITTARNSGRIGYLDVILRDAIERGEVVGPRIIASGPGLTHTGGHGDGTLGDAVDGVDALVAAVRQRVKARVDSIKILGLTAGITTPGMAVEAEGYSLEEVRAAVAEARRFGLLTQVHAIAAKGIGYAIEAGVHSIDHGMFLSEEHCQRMKEKDIPLVPTLAPINYLIENSPEPWRVERAVKVWPSAVNSFQMALEMGVRIVFGSDVGYASRMPNGDNALECVTLVKHGMKPLDVITAATRDAARLLALDDRLGSVEVGKLADLVAVAGNPLDDMNHLLRSVRFVMKGGIVYRDDGAI